MKKIIFCSLTFLGSSLFAAQEKTAAEVKLNFAFRKNTSSCASPIDYTVPVNPLWTWKQVKVAVAKQLSLPEAAIRIGQHSWSTKEEFEEETVAQFSQSLYRRFFVDQIAQAGSHHQSNAAPAYYPAYQQTAHSACAPAVTTYSVSETAYSHAADTSSQKKTPKLCFNIYGTQDPEKYKGLSFKNDPCQECHFQVEMEDRLVQRGLKEEAEDWYKRTAIAKINKDMLTLCKKCGYRLSTLSTATVKAMYYDPQNRGSA